MEINSIILKAVDNPATRVNREEFLRKILYQYKSNLSQEEQQRFIDNPVQTIGINEVNYIADKTISESTWKTASLSFVAGIPGGFGGIVAAAPDVLQNLRYYITLSQKLAYLYGVNFYENNSSSDEYRNSSTLLCLGFMLGANGVDTVIQKLISTAWQQSGKEFVEYLMKSVGFSLAKKIAAKLGENLTKKSVSSFLSKAIPIVGGLLSGGLTFASFKSAASLMQKKLIKYNNDLKLV